MGGPVILRASIGLQPGRSRCGVGLGGEGAERCRVSAAPAAQLAFAADDNSRVVVCWSEVGGRDNSLSCASRSACGNSWRYGVSLAYGSRCGALRFGVGRRWPCPQQGFRSRRLVVAAGEQSDGNSPGEDPVETLFMRELRRRGISSDSKGTAGTDTRTKSDDAEDIGEGSSRRRWSQQDSYERSFFRQKTAQSDDQLKRSRALNSEGLEGLLPRAQELLKLGGSFWIVFWPLIFASVAMFATLYMYFGTGFLHAGSSVYPGGRPPYVEPYQLLEEERIPSDIGPDRVPFAKTSSS